MKHGKCHHLCLKKHTEKSPMGPDSYSQFRETDKWLHICSPPNLVQPSMKIPRDTVGLENLLVPDSICVPLQLDKAEEEKALGIS